VAIQHDVSDIDGIAGQHVSLPPQVSTGRGTATIATGDHFVDDADAVASIRTLGATSSTWRPTPISGSPASSGADHGAQGRLGQCAGRRDHRLARRRGGMQRGAARRDPLRYGV
jgi:hypothetical protein